MLIPKFAKPQCTARMFAIACMIFVAGICSIGAPAHAADLSLGGDQFWAVFASRQDADDAIAVAQQYRESKPRVVHSTNGWFAVVTGPHPVHSGTGREFLDGLIKAGAPKDVFLTKGGSFTETVWTPPASNVVDTVQYDGEHDATLRKDDLEIKLTRRNAGEDGSVAVATGTFKGKPAFNLEFSDHPSEKPASQVALVRLDPSSPMPQVVFTYFWQGAHCCTMTKIASLTKEGSWHIIDGDNLDGDGGYLFEDLRGKGFSYLISWDQSFLYAFDSYAGSLAPMQIHQLVGDKLVNVTTDAEFQHRLLQSLFSQEENAGRGDDSWHSNGFLAGWVASSILVGRGDSAWSKMLANYDHRSDFATEKCSLDIPLEKCPDDKKLKLAFPFALRQFLADHGYISDVSRYTVPYEIEPASPSQPSSPENNSSPVNAHLQLCVGQSELVRKLIYQTFAGRKMRSAETYDSVTLHQDTTLEDFDANTQKTTCAVSYDIALKSLIGRLAEDGNFARAETLNRLGHGSGGVVTARVRYTVKPTATPGTVFVELTR